MFKNMLTGFLRKMLAWVLKFVFFSCCMCHFENEHVTTNQQECCETFATEFFWLTVIEIETFHINTKGFQRLTQAKAKSHETETTLQKVISAVVFDVGTTKEMQCEKTNQRMQYPILCEQAQIALHWLKLLRYSSIPWGGELGEK